MNISLRIIIVALFVLLNATTKSFALGFIDNTTLKICKGAMLKKEWDKAEPYCKDAAETKNAEAQYLYSLLLEFNSKSEEDKRRSFNLATASAEQGYSLAAQNLSLKYLYGNGVDDDYSKALYWAGKATEDGSDSSAYNLGSIYYSGDKNGKGKNYKLAKKWFQKSLKVPHSLYYLGLIYENEGNIIDAYDYYQQATEKGNVAAYYTMGRRFLAEYKNLPEEKAKMRPYAWKEARKWLWKASMNGHTLAQFTLANELISQDNPSLDAKIIDAYNISDAHYLLSIINEQYRNNKKSLENQFGKENMDFINIGTEKLLSKIDNRFQELKLEKKRPYTHDYDKIKNITYNSIDPSPK